MFVDVGSNLKDLNQTDLTVSDIIDFEFSIADMNWKCLLGMEIDTQVNTLVTRYTASGCTTLRTGIVMKVHGTKVVSKAWAGIPSAMAIFDVGNGIRDPLRTLCPRLPILFLVLFRYADTKLGSTPILKFL